MRNSVLAVVTALLLMFPPGVAAAQHNTAPPEKLDVEAALDALETEQIYRAPGAVVYFDEEFIRPELTPDIRILIGPFTGRYGAGSPYASADEHHEQVYQPLQNWAEEHDKTLIRVEGLAVASSEGVATTPSDIDEHRQLAATYDITESLWLLIQHAKGADTSALSEVSSGYSPTDIVEPSPEQVDKLSAELREHGFYNAPGREDRLDLPIQQIEERTGLRVRAAAFPVTPPGEPIVDYAPALAEQFPGETVLVAHGAWLDVAGAHQSEFTEARDYAYGRYERGTFSSGLVMNDRIGTVLFRADELLDEYAFSRPQPRTLRQLILDLAPWMVGGSALLLGGVSLGYRLIRQVDNLRAERHALRRATAEAFTEIAELSRRLLTDDNRDNADAAERHATASNLFEQAHTAEAMTEVREIARQGMRLLPEGTEATS